MRKIRERRLDDVELVKQDVDRISKEEVRAAIKRMKSGKSVGADNIPVEAWRCLGEMAVEFLTRLFNRRSAKKSKARITPFINTAIKHQSLLQKPNHYSDVNSSVEIL
ncbi:hypothetical protein HF521_013073 [Silurus meridionalis]|uniref:Reverse transcriptase n=1 Tax=Silurus meridionalis TaxID=175797 RepID=A0A8T0ACJ1_SILME|nr:hypothetical protein HF521_013073 [Silurus meridionalis]